MKGFRNSIFNVSYIGLTHWLRGSSRGEVVLGSKVTCDDVSQFLSWALALPVVHEELQLDHSFC